MKKLTLTFEVLEGVDKGRVFRELPIPLTLGREEGNSLRLNDERISRFHAKIQTEDGDVILTDLESTNGTRVNGSPVQIRRLRFGDQIGIGRSTLRYGSLEEIAQRRAEQPIIKASAQTGPTLAGTLAGDDMGFDIGSMAVHQQSLKHINWGNNESEMPPLPQKLTPAQAARLCEIFDFLHRGMVLATENIQASEDGSVVRLAFAEWQTVQSIQSFMARYMRNIADPD